GRGFEILDQALLVRRCRAVRPPKSLVSSEPPRSGQRTSILVDCDGVKESQILNALGEPGDVAEVKLVPLADTNLVDRHALRCYWGAVFAVSDTNSPGPGVASIGLRHMLRHWSRGLRRFVALELANWKCGEPRIDLVRAPDGLPAGYTRPREAS